MTVVFSSILTPVGLDEPQVRSYPSVGIPDAAVLWWALAGLYLLGFVLWGSLRLSLSLLLVLETWNWSWESGPSGTTAHTGPCEEWGIACGRCIGAPESLSLPLQCQLAQCEKCKEKEGSGLASMSQNLRSILPLSWGPGHRGGRHTLPRTVAQSWLGSSLPQHSTRKPL